MLYQLMNKDVIVATCEEHKDIDEYYYEEVNRFDPYLPHGFIDINDCVRICVRIEFGIACIHTDFIIISV